ncbi:MAG: hypothetical protein D9V44_09115 [Actinobacteria bacterium]|nr:MAG: hypothetical protein D9V44_09115 [Actinomycetota bacterium]
MKRSIIAVLTIALIAALAFPALAFAGKGNDKPTGNRKTTAASAESKGKAKGVAKREATPEQRKANQKTRGVKQGADGTGDAKLPESDVATDAPGPGVTNAFTRITANIEKALAKIEAGTKLQVPPGLLRVWLKFAGWLGVDPSTMPGTPVIPPAEEPTSTVEPTATVEPTGTVEPPPVIDGVVLPAP